LAQRPVRLALLLQPGLDQRQLLAASPERMQRLE